LDEWDSCISYCVKQKINYFLMYLLLSITDIWLWNVLLRHWEVENNLYLKTSGTSSSFFQHTHYSRLIPIITSNCTSKSVAVRR
jgi:hypothetical protein